MAVTRWSELFPDVPLTENEYQAVKDWFSTWKDDFEGDFKNGLAKMLDKESHEQMRREESRTQKNE